MLVDSIKAQKSQTQRITGHSELEGTHKDHQYQPLSEWPMSVISYQLSC